MLKWVKFLKDYQVQAEGGVFYKKDQMVQMAPSSANHFLIRRLVVLCDGPKPKPEPAKARVVETFPDESMMEKPSEEETEKAVVENEDSKPKKYARKRRKK